MGKKFCFVCLIILIATALLEHATAQPLFAQTNETAPINSEDTWFEYIDWTWKGKFRPCLAVNYGVGKIKRKEFQGGFNDIGVLELKFGSSQIRPFHEFVKVLDETCLFGSYGSKDLATSEGDTSNVNPEMTRFGFGSRLGFGYRSGSVDILPYNQMGFAWTKFEFDRPTDLSEQDGSILDRYEGTFRFGQLAEAGIQFQLRRSFGVVGSYEWAVVIPRFVFWEWLGSTILQYGLNGAITIFSERIIQSSPAIGPIVSFFLQNGLSYAFYSGMQNDMNWPFNSETPITMETLKLGATVTF